MNHFVGMDLHSNNTVIGVIDERGQRIFARKVENDLDLILSILKPFKDMVSGIVIESTFNWYWLADGLMDAGYKVRLANPYANQQYSGLKYSNDKHDAFWLAELLRLNILKEGHIHSRPERQLRDLLRKRLMLVRQRTQHILSFKSLMNRNLNERIGSNLIKTLQEEDMDSMIEEHHLNMSARANISVMTFLNQRIRQLEKEIIASARLRPEFENLMTVTGIGISLSLTIALETGDIKRFDSVGDYASYCRCVPGKRISNEKQKGTGNRKNGNKYLGWAFVEAAICAKRFSPAARRYFEKKARKTKRVIAIKALAHKLARACYYIMRDGVRFDETKLFGSPIKVDTGCRSESARGLRENLNAPIDMTSAAPIAH